MLVIASIATVCLYLVYSRRPGSRAIAHGFIATGGIIGAMEPRRINLEAANGRDMSVNPAHITIQVMSEVKMAAGIEVGFIHPRKD